MTAFIRGSAFERRLAPTTTWLCALAAAGALAACAGSSGPSSTLDRYGAALERGDYDAAYALMSERFREQHSAEEFAAMMEESGDELDETVERLRGGYEEIEVAAELRYGLGDTMRLIREDGQWRIASNPIQFYNQATPREALRSFLRAYRHERWDVMLRFVPNDYRERMTPEMVEEQFTGSRAEEIRGMMDLLEANLDAPITDQGNEARMPFGDRYETRFVREDGRWKIDEPY